MWTCIFMLAEQGLMLTDAAPQLSPGVLLCKVFFLLSFFIKTIRKTAIVVAWQFPKSQEGPCEELRFL